MRRASPADRNAGFTLVEALVSMLLMGLILASLTTLTTQWLPNWNRGFVRVQNNEAVSIAMDRIVTDLSAAEYVVPNRDMKDPLFEGTQLSATFVRTAIGPNTKPGLEIVRIAETADRNGWVVVRMRAPFVPFGVGPVTSAQVRFTDPVILMRAPYRVSFDYAGADGIWKNTWRNLPNLPASVRITVRDAASERALAISSAARIHVEVRSVVGCEQGDTLCENTTPQAAAPDPDPAAAQQERAMR
jgi:general secretion pathway protein J